MIATTTSSIKRVACSRSTRVSRFAFVVLIGANSEPVLAYDKYEDQTRALVAAFQLDLAAIHDNSKEFVSQRIDRSKAINDMLVGLASHENVTDITNQIHVGAFGCEFVEGRSGFLSVGADEDASVSSFDGVEVQVSNYRVWPVDVLASGFALPEHLNYAELLAQSHDLTFGTEVYAGSFGAGPEHIGYRLHAEAGGEEWATFVPLAIPGSDLPAEVGAEVLARALNKDVSEQFDPFADLDPYTGPQSLGVDLIQLAFQLADAGYPCDPWALVNCLISVLNDYNAACAATRAGFQSQIDQLLANWANGQNADMWAWVLGGAATGALGGAGVGSLAGGAGAIPGAIIGAIAGAATGGFAWLVGAGFSAADITAQVTALQTAMNSALCANMRDAANKAKECYRMYCPDMYIIANQEIDAAVAASGC